MNITLLFLPVAAAFMGWGIHKIALSIFIKRSLRKEKIIGAIANIPVEDIFSIDEVADKITSKETLDKIMPAIGEHIDHFLKVKLKQSMPVVAMFISDKTIAQLKQVFLDELEILFPQIMNNYVGQLKKDFDLQKIITEKINAHSEEKLQQLIMQAISKPLQYLEIVGAVSGFIIGMLVVITTFFIVK